MILVREQNYSTYSGTLFLFFYFIQNKVLLKWNVKLSEISYILLFYSKKNVYFQEYRNLKIWVKEGGMNGVVLWY